MITLKKLDGNEFVLNCELIETIEERPDTTIRLTNKTYHIVEENMEEIIKKVVEYKRECYNRF